MKGYGDGTVLIIKSLYNMGIFPTHKQHKKEEKNNEIINVKIKHSKKRNAPNLCNEDITTHCKFIRSC